jgi:hypothetical protein
MTLSDLLIRSFLRYERNATTREHQSCCPSTIGSAERVPLRENIGKAAESNLAPVSHLNLHLASVTVERGVCYRLYPHSLFDEKINENIDSEMARQPLLVSDK